MDNENVSVDQDGGESDVDQPIDTVAIDLEPEKPKEYPRIKISQYKTIDPKSLNKAQLQAIKIKLDLKALDRLKIVIDPLNPYTIKAVEFLSLDMDDLVIKQKSYFQAEGETAQECQIRYNLYLLQHAEVIRQLISEEFKLKKSDRDDSTVNKQITESQNSLSVYGLPPIQNYKSPLEMIDGWIEDKTEKAMKYQIKTEKLKKDRIMEEAMKYDVFLKKKKEDGISSEKKARSKSKLKNERVKAAHQFNEQMEEVKIRKRQQQGLNIINSLKLRKEQLDIGEKGFEQFKQKQQEMISMKIQINRDKMEANLSKVTKQRKILLDEHLIKNQIKKQDESESRRRNILEQVSGKLTTKSVNLVKVQSLKEFQTQQSEYEKYLGFVSKNKKIEMHEHIVQSKIDKIAQDKQEKNKELEEVWDARKKKIQKHLEESAEEINNYLSKNQDQVEKLNDKKEAFQVERMMKKKQVTERNIRNFDRVKQEYQEKLMKMLQKQNAINQQNQSVFSKRNNAIQKIMLDRAHSQKEVENYSMKIDDQISKTKRKPKTVSVAL